MTQASLDEWLTWMTMRIFHVARRDFISTPCSHPRPDCKLRNPALSGVPELAFFASRSSQNYGTKEGTPLNPVVLRLIWLHAIHAPLPEVDSSMHFTRSMD
jgi:hypothetical protein